MIEIEEARQSLPDRVKELIREVTDPVEFRQQIEELLSESQPEPVFVEGDDMPMHAFVKLFKERVCEGNETKFWQWQVRVARLGDELAVGLGTSITGKTRRIG